MRLDEAFPSAFLKASDLAGRAVTVTIDFAEIEMIGQGREKERKLLLGFRGKEKKLVLNKTNANTIASMYGDDTDHWIGKRITLVAREVEFQGELVQAIRVQTAAGTAAPAPAPRAPAAAPRPAAARPAAARPGVARPAPRPAPAPAPVNEAANYDPAAAVEEPPFPDADLPSASDVPPAEGEEMPPPADGDDVPF